MTTAPMRGSIHETLLGQAVALDTLTPHPDNPREHDEDVIRESLILNGQYGPIVVQKSTNRVLAGNGTYAAALSLQWTHIAAVVVDVDDEQATKILLADNRINQVGGNDPTALMALLKDLDGQFGGTGYTATDFTELMRVVEGSALGSLGDLGDYEPTSTQSLRPVNLSYDIDTFNTLVRQLMTLRLHDEETFTEVVQRLVAEALAKRE